MFCEKCGTQNEKDAKFCLKCGNELKHEKNNGGLIKKIKDLPKGKKIAMVGVILVVIGAIATLSILLNNPVKRISDKLNTYYASYEEDDNTLLEDIGKILKDNKKDKEKLNKISKASHDIIGNWVKNFNTSYDNKDDLDDAYDKVSDVLKSIYNYYDGLKYILEDDLYYEYIEDLRVLHNSKANYLYGKDEDDEYSKYVYFQRVIEEDSYYKEAQKYVSDYVKEELDTYTSKVEAMVKVETTNDTELLDLYLEQLEYLNGNKVVNNIDLSSTKEYKDLYSKCINKILDLINKVTKEYEKTLDYNKALDLVNKAIKEINDKDKTKDLETLKEDLEKKLPDNLTDKFVVDYDNSYDASYKVTIKEEEYNSYVQFSFNGENAYRIFRINKDYTKFKTKIVVGDNWPADFKGEIKITSGDKELFKSGEITKESDFKADVEIDITDVDELKIEFVTTNDSGYDDYYLYLVEPYLYK